VVISSAFDDIVSIRNKMEEMVEAPWSLSKNLVYVGLVKYSERKLIHKLRKKGFVGHLLRPVKRKHVQMLFNQLSNNTKPIDNPKKPIMEVTNVQPCRILVVDDNHNNLEFASLLLKKLGFNCSLAGSGEEALQILKEVQYDLLFLDVQMPNMNGYEVTRIVREKQRKKGQQAISIVAMTAGALAEERNRALQAGMDAFISKPVVMKDMKDILDKYVPIGKHPNPQEVPMESEMGDEQDDSPDSTEEISPYSSPPRKKSSRHHSKTSKSSKNIWLSNEPHHEGLLSEDTDSEDSEDFEPVEEEEDTPPDPSIAIMMKMLEQKNTPPSNDNSTLIVVISSVIVLLVAVLFTIVLTSKVLS